MQLSEQGLELIKRSEGFRAQTYKDMAGFPTIGFGHKLLPGESYPEGIDEARASALLANDVKNVEQAVEKLVKVTVTQGQFDALVDFCYNLGSARLASSTLLRELNAGRYDEAREQLLRWDNAEGKVVADLEARREAESRLWESMGASKPRAAGGNCGPGQQRRTGRAV